MSPQVGNFVADLVEMAKATEELPQIKAALAQAHADIEAYAKSLQAREEAIIRHKAELEELNQRIRKTEAERDDAELRFLELDEKAHQVLGVLDLIAAKAADSKAKLDPPKPEPVAQPEPTPEPVYPWAGQGGGLSQPIHPSATTTADGSPYVPPTPAPAPEVASPSWDPQPSTTAGSTDASGSGTPQASVGSGGTSETPSPTPAPSAPTGTGTDYVTSSSAGSSPSESSTPSGQEASSPSSDPEPAKYTAEAPTTITQAWWDWYDRQPYQFRQDYKF